jgi:leucyl-tRNA synthetase
MVTLTKLVAPMIPHVAEAANAVLTPENKLVALQAWPQAEAALLVKDEVTIAVQVNGKLRGTFAAPAGIEKAAALEIAKGAVAGALQGQSVVKEIFVPDRIVNFVVKG